MKITQAAFMCIFLLAIAQETQAQYWTTPAPVTLPNIPGGTYNITGYGASTSSSDNATAIQNAINAASAAGSGTVQVPAGTFLTGPIHLTNNINLNLASGATLKMLPYGVWPGSTFFITCYRSHDVEISGAGTIDGQGQAWWNAFAANPALARPVQMDLGAITGLEITGIRLQNSPSPHIRLNYNTNVTVTSVTIYTVPAPGQSPAKNTDGVDMGNLFKVYFANNSITCGDDNVVTGGKYIDVENCTFGAGHGCSIGSHTEDGVSFVTVHNCTFNGTTVGIRMKSARGQGGVVQYLAYNNNIMTSVPHPIWISSYYPADPTDPTLDSGETFTSTTPVWKHIKVQSLTATGSTDAGTLFGLPESRISDVTFDNVKISATTGMNIYHANSIVFTNGSSVSVSSGYPVTIYDATVSGISTHIYP
jgi:polygalacturonase